MVTIKTVQEIACMREGGRILAHALDACAKAVRPGISIRELDTLAKDSLSARDGRPAFLGYGKAKHMVGFPSTLCISINDEVVHGTGTRDIILKEGDIVGLDIGVQYPAKGGLFTDMATTVAVGDVTAQARELMRVTRESLDASISLIRPGAWTRDISQCIQAHCEKHGFNVIRDLTGHGVGYAVHEEPPIFCYWESRLPNVQLKEGMVICIEPMVVAGDWHVKVDSDQWTIRTIDGSLAAHEEDTIAVTAEGYEILTRP